MIKTDSQQFTESVQCHPYDKCLYQCAPTIFEKPTIALQCVHNMISSGIDRHMQVTSIPDIDRGFIESVMDSMSRWVDRVVVPLLDQDELATYFNTYDWKKEATQYVESGRFTSAVKKRYLAMIEQQDVGNRMPTNSVMCFLKAEMMFGMKAPRRI